MGWGDCKELQEIIYDRAYHKLWTDVELKEYKFWILQIYSWF